MQDGELGEAGKPVEPVERAGMVTVDQPGCTPATVPAWATSCDLPEAPEETVTLDEWRADR